MNKLKSSKIDNSFIVDFFSKKSACYLTPFFLLTVIFAFCAFNGRLSDPNAFYLTNYLFNYDGGFIARGLVGEVLSWFFDTINDDIIFKVCIFFSICYIVAFSLFIGKMLVAARGNKERTSLILTAFIVICIIPFSFREQFADGKTERFMWSLSLFSVFIADRKYSAWFIPVLCVGATLINTKYLVISMIFLAIVLLQQFHNEGYSVKRGAICALAYVSMIVIGLTAHSLQKNISFSDSEEMINYFFSRYDGELSESSYKLLTGRWTLEYFSGSIDAWKELYTMHYNEKSDFVCTIVIALIFIALPLMALTSFFWLKVLKNEENKFQRFIYFCCAAMPVTVIMGTFMTGEPPTYITYNILMQLCLLIYFVGSDKTAVLKTLRRCADYFKSHILLSLAVIGYFIQFCVR